MGGMAQRAQQPAGKGYAMMMGMPMPQQHQQQQQRPYAGAQQKGAQAQRPAQQFGGKGGGYVPGSNPRQQNPQALEARYVQEADALYESVMDLNVPMQYLSQAWDTILKLRTQITAAYTTGPAHAGAGAAPNGGATDGTKNWKGDLTTIIAKSAGRSMTKDEIKYETGDAEGGGYISTLTCEFLSQQYVGEEASKSKKEAEQATAMVAMMTEFPEACGGFGGQAQPQRAVAGQKRDRQEAAEVTPKGRLTQVAQLLIGPGIPSVKGDIVFVTTAHEDGSFTSTVALPKYDADGAWEGAPAENKKLAEHNAAHAACIALADIVAPLEQEQAAKKARKSKESLERMKETQEAKRLAKEVADGGAAVGGKGA